MFCIVLPIGQVVAGVGASGGENQCSENHTGHKVPQAFISHVTHLFAPGRIDSKLLDQRRGSAARVNDSNTAAMTIRDVKLGARTLIGIALGLLT